MPIIWRYLLGQYLKVLAFTVISFLIALFVCQLRRLVQFALLGAGAGEVIRFGLYLVPYILPIALPIGCLIASLLLFQRLSHSHELVALGACGLGMKHILTPLLLGATALSLANFYVASELATHCHLLGMHMKSRQSTLNPLVLLQNAELLQLGDIFLNMRTTRSGEEVKAIALARYNPSTNRLNVLTADRLYRDGPLLRGDQVNVIAPLAGDGDSFDCLIVENQKNMWMESKNLTQLVGRASFHPKNHYLRLQLLIRKLAEDREQLRLASSSEEIEPLRRRISQGKAEIIRRFSIALAAFTFTTMGAVFGMDRVRRRTHWGIVEAVAFAALFMVCFLTATEVGDWLVLSATLYLFPHLLVLTRCAFRLRQLHQGKTA